MSTGKLSKARNLLGEFMAAAIVACAVAALIVFSSGALLRTLTGIDSNRLDWIITLSVSPIAAVFLARYQRRVIRGIDDMKIRRRVRERQQFKQWADVRPLMDSGTGTLIVELISFGPSHGIQWRTWWTPDDVVKLGPAHEPINTCHCNSGDHPFIDWCVATYLAEPYGKAFLFDSLINPPDEDYILPEPLNCLAVPFQRRFPLLQVVVIPALSRRLSFEVIVPPQEKPGELRSSIREAASGGRGG